MKQYRKLAEAEIDALKRQGCTADNWNNIEVAERFTPEWIRNVDFSGIIKLGVFEKSNKQLGSIEFHSGIHAARLHNVEIGDNCWIDKVHNYIANYRIGDNVVIENTNLIVCDGESTFGNGVMVPVMNEGGGREIPIYDRLSAPLAYMLALYRHDKEFISRMEKLINEYAESRRDKMGTIENNVKIFNCGTIKNTFVGSYATLGGVSKLSNGSLNSNSSAPIHLGSGVKCNDFIISSGTEITDSTLVSRCFVGQGCVMGKHYSALDSLFFANCQGFHGEATAIFAGPYTVSHHKSSLLIAGMFSFLNAGSASNQSNHMYKLGPIHQGMVERGSKTTSNSYLLWPAKIGAFTLVMGRHTKHSDTSELPFSYLIENATESYLVPAVNLRSVGTVRDAQKWPKRDERKDPDKLDCINFNLLSPYTAQKIIAGMKVLNNIKKLAGETSEEYIYQNCHIRNNSLRSGYNLYKTAILKFLGNSIISRIMMDENGKVLPAEQLPKSIEEIRCKLKPDTMTGTGAWVDLSGMLCPRTEVDIMLADIASSRLTLAGTEERIRNIHANYYKYEWTWVYELLTNYFGQNEEFINIDKLIEIVNMWYEAVEKLDDMLYNDAKKEFNLQSQTGFGIDGDEKDKVLDFEQVRGRFEDNSFVRNCIEHKQKKKALADITIAHLLSIKS